MRERGSSGDHAVRGYLAFVVGPGLSQQSPSRSCTGPASAHHKAYVRRPLEKQSINQHELLSTPPGSGRLRTMASSSSKSVVLPAVVLALRLLALAVLVGSLALIVTDPEVHSSIPLQDKPISLRFKDVYTYRYVLAIAVIGCAYNLVQVPLAAVTIAAKKRVIGRTTNMALILICVDVIFAIVFATAAGACYGFSYDAKRFVDGVYNDSDRFALADADFVKLHNDLDMFFLRAYVAAGLMLLAAKCTGAVIVVSAIALVK